ncbi:amidase [Anaeromyxobacter paludicola]|uniref:6-aminohexanoate-cyclic-dimer hydrolase n=1 Tax=Anaeromyxobacter paludicola TaxID=2918171 RepID=A0ABN6N2C1_9BACT|nr:amidase family protein [Anaeromyxobacter paludicola]BDG07355.1 6-aminohexanoate-cyclic-dimer hydrolase [Anaeromyxobacter paludicola]
MVLDIDRSAPSEGARRLFLPEYDRLDATALAELVARREVTPAELLEAAIARVEARNPALNAVVGRHDEEARAVARGPLPGGPFRGVPFLLKDFLGFKKGWPQTASSRLFEKAVAPEDSEIVRRFRRAGLVLFGQTNTPELAIHAFTESRLRGTCRNPWDPDFTPGGSSGGSAAAVAARMVPMAHANDGGGSIRIPASCCGLFGLKPTRGRVSFAPFFGDVLFGFVQELAVTRSVRDAAALLDAVAGPMPGDPYAAPPPARPFREEAGAPPGRLRIAFTTRSLFGHSTSPECRAAVEAAAGLLASLGHDVEEAHPPFARDALVRAYLVALSASIRADLEELAVRAGQRLDPSRLEPETWALAVAGRVLRADAVAWARTETQRAARELAGFFAVHDLLLTPTLAHPPARTGAFQLRPIERLGLAAMRRLPSRPFVELLLESISAKSFEATGNTMLFNQTGQPAASIPLHWSGAGLPIGVQLAARFGDEATLLRVAAQLEEARPWAGRVPPIAA